MRYLDLANEIEWTWNVRKWVEIKVHTDKSIEKC